MALLEQAKKRALEKGSGDLEGPTFLSMREGLSNMSLLKVLKLLNRRDLTTHRFRSTFRDWAAETTDYPRKIGEMALAHTIANRVEAAYRRPVATLPRARHARHLSTMTKRLRRPSHQRRARATRSG